MKEILNKSLEVVINLSLKDICIVYNFLLYFPGIAFENFEKFSKEILRRFSQGNLLEIPRNIFDRIYGGILKKIDGSNF